MTVIAWDGTTLAADKRACNGNTIYTTTKIFRVGTCLLGAAGHASFCEQIIAWFKAGENPSDFPAAQRDKDDWAGLLVIRGDGTINKYERTPYPHTFEDKQIAIGSGCEFAKAAMHLGCTAAQAVEVAIALDCSCGNGVDTLTLVEETEVWI